MKSTELRKLADLTEESEKLQKMTGAELFRVTLTYQKPRSLEDNSFAMRPADRYNIVIKKGDPGFAEIEAAVSGKLEEKATELSTAIDSAVAASGIEVSTKTVA